MRSVLFGFGVVVGALMLLSFLMGAWRKPSGEPNDAPAKGAVSVIAKPSFSKSGFNIKPLSQEKINDLAKGLTAEEAKVILNKGTEPAFCGNLVDNHLDGLYACRLCSLPLFKSDAKFDSGTGWPSFFQPFDPDHVATKTDRSYGMERVEILCTRCDAHLGHVFDDGPKPTRKRFCLNSVSLTFHEAGKPMPAALTPVKLETAYFAGGCFWGVEDRFAQLPGVVDAVSGYMGGTTKNPTYRDVSYKETGHAETVKIVFDPSVITYKDLLAKFFKFHDPTQVNRQGPDFGTQYRSAIFAADAKQAEDAKAFISEQAAGRFKTRKIATQLVTPDAAGVIPEFYEAEDYHQDYHVKNGGHCALPTGD